MKIIYDRNEDIFLENTDYRNGLRDGVAVALGYFAVAFTFGMASVANGLGILQAVGMTDIQLKTMFKIEILSYTGISSACTLIFGSLLGYALVIAIIQSGIEMVYSFPWLPILLYIILMFLTQHYLADYSIKLLHKENLVERMKNTE